MQLPYSRYAAIYDQTGQHRFGAIMAELTIAWLRRRGVTPQTALDLATGTGSAALSLAIHGVRTIGLDRSPAMLDQAREKATRAGLSVTWLEGDMRAFSLAEPVDLITCFFDSVNYLLEVDDLRRCFASVSVNLQRDGWFVFDLTPIHRYATDWNGSSDVAYSDDKLLCLFRSSFDRETHRSPLILTVFEREDAESDCWRSWEETHVERGYPLSLISELLKAAGLSVEACSALDEKEMQLSGPATETSMRAVFFARKTCAGGRIHP